MDCGFDIETIPDQRPESFAEVFDALTPPDSYFNIPASCKSDNAIAKRQAENEENLARWEANRKIEATEKWQKTAVKSAFGQIVCASWKVDNKPVRSAWSEDWADEKTILQMMFDRMDQDVAHGNPMLVGHNLLAFDLPFVQMRAMIHNVQMPHWWPVLTKPYHDRVRDTMLLWGAGKQAESGTGNMDFICSALGIPLKGSEFDDQQIQLADGSMLDCRDISGKNVWQVVEAGRVDLVVHYCEGDVERTMAMFQRMAGVLGLRHTAPGDAPATEPQAIAQPE